jgi:hypothetical protein
MTTEQESPAAGAERCEEHGRPLPNCAGCADLERAAYWRELRRGTQRLLNETATAQTAVLKVGLRFRQVRQDDDEIGADATADLGFEIEQAMRSLRHVQRIAAEHAAYIDRELRGEG